MSTAMNPEQGQQVLFKQVYLPKFKEKCAERGINFATDEDLREGLETVALLKFADGQQTGGAIKQASSALRKVLGVPQTDEIAKAAQEQAQVKQASQDETIRGAVDAFLAGQLQQQQPQGAAV